MKTIRVQDAPAAAWGNVVGIPPHMTDFVARIERQAQMNPLAYRRRVAIAGLLGYLVIGGLVLIALGLAAACVGLIIYAPQAVGLEIKLLFVFGMLAVGIVRALWVREEPPEGHAVHPAQTPALFALVEEVRGTTRGPIVHEIRIIDRLNAAIVQSPRWFGIGNRNTLFIGAPLLQATQVDECRAIIAHEMGHFIGAHGRSAGFVYRVRRRWSQVAERLSDGVFARLLKRFFDWYGPWFASYSFVLARQQEYEADRIAAIAEGKEVAARALLRVTCQHARHEQVWRAVWEQAHLRADPPTSPTAMSGCAMEGPDDQDQFAIDRELESLPGLGDTHPGLASRLAALGVEPFVPPPLAGGSAFDLLGEARVAIAKMLDDDWHAGCSPHWAERFRERQDAISERAALSDSLARGEIDDDGRFRLAELIEQIDGPIAGATAFDDVAKVVADPDPALSRQGIALLDAGQDAGLPLLEHAAERFPGVADRLYDHIIAYLEGAGRREEASRYRALLRQAQDISEQRRIEAEGIDEAVELRPLTDDVHAAAVASVVGVDGVRRLYVALRHLPVAGTDQLICVVQPGSGRSGQEVVGDVLARLAQLCDVLCIQASRDRRWLVRRLEAVEGSRLV